MDAVFVRDIAIQALIGEDAWSRKKPQPALVAVKVFTDISVAGVSDQIDDTLDYRIINSAVSRLNHGSFSSVGDFASTIQKAVLEGFASRISRCEIDVRLPKGVLHAGAHKDGGVRLERSVTRSDDGSSDRETKRISLEQLGASCIIGVGDHERKTKQPVSLTLRFEDEDTVAYQNITASVIEVRGTNGITRSR